MEQRAIPQSKFVSIDTYSIHYTELGEGSPVLFVHRNPTSSFVWRNIMPGIAATGRRCIAVNLLGFGQSAKHNF